MQFNRGSSQQSNIASATGMSFNQMSTPVKKSSIGVSKPVDPQIIEDMKNIVSNLQTNDWSKRLKGIDELLDYIKTHGNLIRT